MLKLNQLFLQSNQDKERLVRQLQYHARPQGVER
jgi:hypothetical protein